MFPGTRKRIQIRKNRNLSQKTMISKELKILNVIFFMHCLSSNGIKNNPSKRVFHVIGSYRTFLITFRNMGTAIVRVWRYWRLPDFIVFKRIRNKWDRLKQILWKASVTVRAKPNKLYTKIGMKLVNFNKATTRYA